ncbi:outer membrane autotransporter protein [Agrobacterium vitis]|nr:outer membrane autotransporter protein [Agrobacterium vitis]
MTIGNTGQAMLNINAGGTLTSSHATIGTNAGGDGHVTVSGSGSKWTSTGNIYVGNGGNGALTVENAAVVSAVDGYVSTLTGSTSSLMVSGASSAMNLSGVFIAGYSAGTSATVTLSNGGQITGLQGTLGDLAGSSGSMTITGSGAKWSAFVDNSVTYSGFLNVGRLGTGNLTVSNGGMVSGERLYIGNEVGSEGTVTLNGHDTRLQMNNNLYVGSEGTGTLTLSDDAQISAATIKIGYLNGSTGTLNVGAASGQTAAAAGTINTSEIVLGAGASKLVLNHTSNSFGLSANITGSGQVNQLNGITILTGANTYTGGTTISGGTLSIGNGGTAGSIAGNITDNASLVFNRSDDVQYANIISGTGSVTKAGAGTLTLTGTNSYTGGTTVSAGILQLGNGANTGSLTGAIANSGTVVFNRYDDVVAGGTISGSGALIKRGSGKLTLAGNNSAVAGTTVEQGSLQISDGTSLTSDVTVGSGAALLATNGGAINGTVSVQDGGMLALAPPTVPGYGLSMTGLTLSHNAILSVGLGAPTGTALASVGTLSLDGILNVTNAGAMAQGVYRLLDYTTLASNAGLRLGTTPSDFSYEIQQVPGQVNLSALTSTMSYWNGSQTTADGTVHGGNGTWSNNAGLTNWTTPQANQSRGWSNTFAVFGGTAGTVTIDNTFGAVSAPGLQFMVDGYNLTGGQLTLAAPSGQTPIRVGDGTSSGASFVATISSDITGTTGLEKTDLGTLILTGLNSYTGGTTVTQGTLQIGNGGTSGSILGDVVNSGVLAFNRSDAGTYAGSLSGSGIFNKLGSGTLTLTGTNTYTGNTNVNAGTLIVGGGQAIGDTSAVSVANGARLTVQSNETVGSIAGAGNITLAGAKLTAGGNNSSTIYSGVIDGSGGLVKTGSGVLVLTGTSSYTGGTTIAEGTLQIGNGGTTGSIIGDVVNNANLVFNRSDNYVFNGSVSGTGSVTFKGGGKVVFSSPYNGAVSVEDSFTQLQLGTVTASPFTVNAGGVLGGTASIGGLVINSGGTAAPGYSPGTLTVNGPVTFNSGSIYAVDVTPQGAHDLIIANGPVTISSGANVQVSAVAGRYPSTSKIAIITTSNTITGTFGGVTSNYAFLTPLLGYDAQNVYLTLNYNGANFRDYALTANQTNVADAAQSLGTGKLVFDALYALPQTAVSSALDQLSGEIYASANTVINQQSIYLRDAVGARLRQSEAANGDPSSALNAAAKAGGPVSNEIGKNLLPTVWLQGYGGWGERFGNTNAATVSNTIGGIFGGVDVDLSDTMRVGLIGGFSQSHFDVDSRNSSGSMTNYDLGLYAGKQFGPVALRGGVSHSWHDVTISRNVSFSGFSDSERSDRVLGTTQVFGELAYDLDVGGYNVEPFVGLAYVNTKGGSFRERGLNGAGLSVNTDSQNTLYSTLGARAATSITLGESVLTPSLTLGWQHANGDTTSDATAQFQSGGSLFRVSGVPTAKDTALIGIGVAYDLSETSKFQFNYSGQIATHGVQNAFSAQFSVKF